MSLKYFHIFFISLASLSAFAFAAWILFSGGVLLNTLNMLAALGSVLSGIGLVFYGRKFLQKFKNIKME